MQATIRWLEGASFVGETASGHAVVMDGPADGGGRNIGVRPMEMMLLGVGGCTAYDVMHILRKARQKVSDCTVQLYAQRAATVPSIFTKIHIHFTVIGKQLSAKQVARAIDLSARKYCSASIMLQSTVQITHDYEIKEPQ